MNLVATGKDPSVRVRFPREVLAAVRAEAEKNGRSQNSEIVFRLADSLKHAIEPTPADPATRVTNAG